MKLITHSNSWTWLFVTNSWLKIKSASKQFWFQTDRIFKNLEVQTLKKKKKNHCSDCWGHSAVTEGSTRLGKWSFLGSERMPSKQALFHPAHCLRKLPHAAKGALPHVAQEMWHWSGNQPLHGGCVVGCEPVQADILCKFYSSSFLYPVHHTVSHEVCVSGLASPGLQNRWGFQDRWGCCSSIHFTEVWDREKIHLSIGLEIILVLKWNHLGREEFLQS